MGSPCSPIRATAAAGTLRTLNPEVVAGRNLDIFVYQALVDGQVPCSNHSDVLKWLGAAGFKVNPEWKPCGSVQEVMDFCQEWEDRRQELNYEIDGVVVKVDSIPLQQDMGKPPSSPAGRWPASFARNRPPRW